MSAVPIIIASQNTTADSSLIFYYVLSIIICFLVIYICSLTIIYGKKNKETIKEEKNDKNSMKNTWLFFIILVL